MGMQLYFFVLASYCYAKEAKVSVFHIVDPVTVFVLFSSKISSNMPQFKKNGFTFEEREKFFKKTLRLIYKVLLLLSQIEKA